MSSETTTHAEVRMQQRGIPPLVIQWLQDFGSATEASGGGQVRFFDKPSRRRLQRVVGKQIVRRVDDFLQAYLIEKDGRVITAGWRYKPIRR